MIKNKPAYLKLCRLIITSKAKEVYNEKFNNGINIIRGENSSGKSTIANMIFYILGGEFNNWTQDAKKCDYVLAEIEVNEVKLVLKREITDIPYRPTEVFFGTYEEATIAAPTKWQIYQAKRSSNKKSYSQLIFELLGFPEIRGDFDSNITMHQIFRMLYVDQLSEVQYFLRNENYDSPLTRRTIGDLLLGQYDDSLYFNQIELRESIKEYDLLKAQIKGLEKILQDAGQETDLKNVNDKITILEQEFEKTRTIIIEFELSKKTDNKVSDSTEKAKKEFLEQREIHEKTKEQLLGLSMDIEESKIFIDSLNYKVEALDQSQITRETVEYLKVTYCPVCLTELDKHVDSDKCTLCKHDLENDEGSKTKIAKLKNEVLFQIKESNKLLLDKNENFEFLKRKISESKSKLNHLKSNLDDEMKLIKTQRTNDLDQALIRKGQIQSEIISLQNHLQIIGLFKQQQDRKAELKSKIAKLEEIINDAKMKQVKNSSKVLAAIESNAIYLLANDLKRETVFAEASEIKINFEKNIFSVNKINNFSASAIVYLKNSIHYAVFFSSLELDVFRYPRFILCDNMEDKGMEEARSQNFQNIIVEYSKKFSKNFQIIFTTSMISPILNTKEYCIGEFYTEQNKSLKF